MTLSTYLPFVELIIKSRGLYFLPRSRLWKPCVFPARYMTYRRLDQSESACYRYSNDVTAISLFKNLVPFISVHSQVIYFLPEIVIDLFLWCLHKSTIGRRKTCTYVFSALTLIDWLINFWAGNGLFALWSPKSVTVCSIAQKLSQQ